LRATPWFSVSPHLVLACFGKSVGKTVKIPLLFNCGCKMGKVRRKVIVVDYDQVRQLIMNGIKFCNWIANVLFCTN